MSVAPGGAGPWRRRPGVLFRRTLGGTVVLARGADAPAVLSPAAGLLWELLETPATTDEIITQVAGSGAGRADVWRLLTELRDAGLIGP